MNTHGHQNIADEVGIPLLETSFFNSGKDQPKLTAFYLGNWLADVSQANLPDVSEGYKVSSELREKLKDGIDKVFGSISDNFMFKGANMFALNVPNKALTEAKNFLYQSVDTYFDSPSSEELYTLIGEGVFLKGYFKFVHPSKKGENTNLTYDIYNQIFQQRYTTYFPHEHLDRPPISPSPTPITWASKKSSGGRSLFNATKQKLPDLYSYLRDDIEMIAATLGEVDRDWACKTFQKGANVDDSDLDWNLNLSKLGYAMHAIEDFFAHSNFTELAVTRGEGKYLPHSYQMLDDQIFRRRLKRYEPVTHLKWQNYPEEDFVVTGYFDDIDNIVSIAHIAEEILGTPALWVSKKLVTSSVKHSKWTDPKGDIKATLDKILSFTTELRDPGRTLRDLFDDTSSFWNDLMSSLEHPEDIEVEFQRILNEISDIQHDPQKEFKNPDNLTAQELKKALGLSELEKLIEEIQIPFADGETSRRVHRSIPGLRNLAEKVFEHHSLFKSIPDTWKPQIRDHFLNLIILLNKGIKGFKIIVNGVQLIGTYADFLKGLIEFFDNPGKWIAKYLVEFGVYKTISEAISATLYYSREQIYDLIGQKRIGCHSLLAKDHGREWLYDIQKNLAKAAHWYVMSKMLRWANEDFRNGDQVVSKRPWIDWLELLEFLLVNPLSATLTTRRYPKIIPVTIFHEVKWKPKPEKEDSLLYLSKQYLPTVVNPFKYNDSYQYWERIADENFDTFDLPRELRKQVVNHVLEVTETGYKVTSPNYAFKPGTIVRIPEQAVNIYVVYGPKEDELWFKMVIDNMKTSRDEDGWKIISGHDRSNRETKVPNIHSPFYISDGELLKLIKRGNDLRKRAEKEYKELIE